MDFSQLGVIGEFLDKHGLATFLVVSTILVIVTSLLPFWKKRSTAATKRADDREDVLLKRVFDMSDAHISFTKEMSKNSAEGNVIMAGLGQHMGNLNSVLEGIIKRLEISEATTAANHAQNVKMFDFFEDFAQQAMQNRGDGRNIIQKQEAAERAVKKSQRKDEVLA